jgi:hypothetical protein
MPVPEDLRFCAAECGTEAPPYAPEDWTCESCTEALVDDMGDLDVDEGE